MTICHIAIKQGTRSGGQSAAAKDDYLERNGRYGKRKNDVLLSESGNMPAWAKTPREYWKAADLYERANGRLFLLVEFALPAGLSEKQQTDLSREFSEKLTGPGRLPYTMAVHSNPRNPHCHVMISERQNDGTDRSPDTWFRKADAKADPGARKTDEFQKPDSYRDMRAMWAGLANAALERAGLDGRLDPRTLEAQGVDREAQIHEGRSPERRAENGEIKRRNARRAELEARLSSADRERRELDALEAEISRDMGNETPEAGLRPEWQGMAMEQAELEACHDALEKHREQAALAEQRTAGGGRTEAGLERLERLKALEAEAAEGLAAQKERMRRRAEEYPGETRAEMLALGLGHRAALTSHVPELRAYAPGSAADGPEESGGPDGRETAAPIRAAETPEPDQVPPARHKATYSELKERRDGLAARLDAEARKTALPEIAEARRKQTEAEAERIKAEKAAIYRDFCDAAADRDAHYEKEPPEPLLLGRGRWRQEHGRWEALLDAKQRSVADLWEKAGGDTGYGKEEVARRLTDEYALEEAEKNLGRSDGWKAALKDINDRAFLEASRRDPETKEALDAADRELAERKAEEGLGRRIAELDDRLSNPPYWIGSAGYPEKEAAADARELLRLESMRLYDESGGRMSQEDALKEAVERHPVLADMERRLGRGRGQGR
jgi:hypothetical protein